MSQGEVLVVGLAAGEVEAGRVVVVGLAEEALEVLEAEAVEVAVPVAVGKKLNYK